MDIIPTLAYVIDLGWFRIGPPYVYLNIDPVIVHLGPLALRWYGLMYVVAIIVGLRIVIGYAARKGINQDLVYRVLWWCIAAGLIGGRLYFVIQQPNFVSYYLANPIHIIATWEGGMAFYGAIFLVLLTLVWRARVEHINPLVLLDAGVLFGAAGQIFGRIGNIINGDIIGYRSTFPWSTVYQNPNSWACLNPATCNVPVQPASVYELLTNIVVLAVLLFLARRVRRPGVLLFVYLFTYAITQFLLFFVRANDIVSFLGLNWGLKQAQWTSLVLFIILLPVSYLVMRSRYARSVPDDEVAATYGIAQPEEDAGRGKAEMTDSDDEEADHETNEPADNSQVEDVADAQEKPVVANKEAAKDAEDAEAQARKGS
jgi:phosphatidylglycerol:prolipoprotein diacylglycerol transferase